MNTAPALCPSCKREVVFEVNDRISLCPACGARFELEQAGPNRKQLKRPRLRQGLIFVAWMFAPAIFAMIAFAIAKAAGAGSMDDIVGKQSPSAAAWIWLVGAAVSCCWACAWFTGCFTQSKVARVLLGLFLGGGLFLCNMVVAFLGGCAVSA